MEEPTENEVRLIYHGSAGSLPRYNLILTDGGIVTVTKEIAVRLVGENIGFSYAESEEKEGVD